MTAKEQLLERLPSLTEAQAVAMLRVADAHAELEAYFEAEAARTPEEQEALDAASARAEALRAVREEPW